MTWQDEYNRQNEFNSWDLIKILAVAFALAVLLFLVIKPVKSNEVDDRTKELCREYAARDHEAEIAPARYEYLGKDFVDSFDWYGSCVNHIRYPVAN